ncbi:glycosyl hydrolase family 8 [Thalassospira sp. MCCC 1A03138]|uniref:glycosyl hydrolase family 8 n=1 Tax=Thalassospira sp. MCCC 1A03138 TaxID=1470576 RepID=UPI000A1F7AD1|nr:glycosyl hydrolase family 8 [Thalassospira sp. MCCC 1A03138]
MGYLRRMAIVGGVGAILCGVFGPMVSAGEAVLRPFPQHQAYQQGVTLPSRWSPAERDADVRAFYQQWKADYLRKVDSGGNGADVQYRVTFGQTQPERTVSEGQGYGMMMAVVMAGADPEARAIFDGLWRFARQWPSDIDPRLMGWQIPPSEEGNDSAFDGDADIAFALLMAADQWGDEAYLAAAREVIAGIGESMIGPQSRLPLLGDWVDPAGAEYDQWGTRPSDFMPEHFSAFARATGDPLWEQVRIRVLEVAERLQRDVSPRTGLLPDFAIVEPDGKVHTAPPNYLEGYYDTAFYFNAARVPWRMASHAVMSGDPEAAAIARKMAGWMRGRAGGDPAAIQSGYMLSGLPLPYEGENSTLFVAPMAVASMLLAGDDGGQKWLDDLYANIRDRHMDYYEDSVTLLCMMVLSGNFWSPSGR